MVEGYYLRIKKNYIRDIPIKINFPFFAVCLENEIAKSSFIGGNTHFVAIECKLLPSSNPHDIGQQAKVMLVS